MFLFFLGGGGGGGGEGRGKVTWRFTPSPPLRGGGGIYLTLRTATTIVQELCESRGGRPGLSDLTSLLVSLDVKLY